MQTALRQQVCSKFNTTNIYQRRKRVQNIEQVKQQGCAKLETPVRWDTWRMCCWLLRGRQKGKGAWSTAGAKHCLLPRAGSWACGTATATAQGRWCPARLGLVLTASQRREESVCCFPPLDLHPSQCSAYTSRQRGVSKRSQNCC